MPVTVRPATSWERFRLHAVDHSPEGQGWLGFSEPMRITPGYLELSIQALLLIGATASSFVLLLLPGYLLSVFRRKNDRRYPFFLFPLPGFALSVVIGFAIWRRPPGLQAESIAGAVLASLALAGVLVVSRRNAFSDLTPTQRVAILFALLLASLGVAKAIYSLGPPDELFKDEISRSLEVGARSDSRINYHLVQMVAQRDHAYGPVITPLLAPWSFSHRGPLAGLAVAPTVLAGPVTLPKLMSNAGWQIFDSQGFAAYRAATIALACCFLLPVFGVMQLILPERRAFLAFLVVVGSPFVIHEIYFTWPKIPTAGLILMAAGLALKQRYVWSGVLVGIAYLTHPSAALAIPIVVGVPLLQAARQGFQNNAVSMLRAWALQSIGPVLTFAFWRKVNGSHFVQDGFLVYFRMCGYLPPTLANWFVARWRSAANTLIPFHLALFDPRNPAIVISGVAPLLTTFFLQAWTSLPSGLGILLYVPFLYWLLLAWKHARLALLVVVILPFLLFLIYWGSFTTGLLREGLHSWFLATVCFAVWSWQRYGVASDKWWRFTSFALLFRGLECLAMLLAPTLVSNQHWMNPRFPFTDAIALATMLATACILYGFTFWFSERLRKATILEVSTPQPEVLLLNRAWF